MLMSTQVSWLSNLSQINTGLFTSYFILSFLTVVKLVLPLREKCPYSELFWSAFPCIQTGYVKTRTRITPNTYTFHAVSLSTNRVVKLSN